MMITKDLTSAVQSFDTAWSSFKRITNNGQNTSAWNTDSTSPSLTAMPPNEIRNAHRALEIFSSGLNADLQMYKQKELEERQAVNRTTLLQDLQRNSIAHLVDVTNKFNLDPHKLNPNNTATLPLRNPNQRFYSFTSPNLKDESENRDRRSNLSGEKAADILQSHVLRVDYDSNGNAQPAVLQLDVKANGFEHTYYETHGGMYDLNQDTELARAIKESGLMTRISELDTTKEYLGPIEYAQTLKKDLQTELLRTGFYKQDGEQIRVSKDVDPYLRAYISSAIATLDNANGLKTKQVIQEIFENASFINRLRRLKERFMAEHTDRRAVRIYKEKARNELKKYLLQSDDLTAKYPDVIRAIFLPLGHLENELNYYKTVRG